MGVGQQQNSSVEAITKYSVIGTAMPIASQGVYSVGAIGRPFKIYFQIISQVSEILCIKKPFSFLGLSFPLLP